MTILARVMPKGPSGFGYGSTAEDVTEGISLRGKTILLTGVTSGIGQESARIFLKRGARVLGTARNAAQAATALAAHGGEAEQTAGFACELGEPASVRACVEAARQDVAARGKKLDVILCNAGIMALPKLQLRHGVEEQFFTNHMGHFLLVTGLLDVLADDGRVVMLSSAAHTMAPKQGIEFDNLGGERGYAPWSAYGQSKLANMLFAKELARRFSTSGSSRTANAVHPGVIATNLMRHLNPVIRAFWSAGSALGMKSVAQGAATQVFVAVHPWAKEKNGEYFADCNIAASSRASCDPELAKKLWDVSENIAARI